MAFDIGSAAIFIKRRFIALEGTILPIAANIKKQKIQEIEVERNKKIEGNKKTV